MSGSVRVGESSLNELIPCKENYTTEPETKRDRDIYYIGRRFSRLGKGERVKENWVSG
jgi:hypothetical protein